MLNSIKLVQDSYCSFVNLEHRKDRLQHMEAQLRRLDFTAVRTPGMMPQEAVQFAGGPTRVNTMLMRTPGAVGCHFSQVKIMLEALRQDKHAFVMEDDLVFCSDFPLRLQHMERFLEGKAWDVLWLGATFHINPPWWHKTGLQRDAELTEDPHMLRTYGAFCTYAYIVNKMSIVRVLTGLDKLLDRSIGIDWAFIQLQPDLFTYAFVPGSVIQFDNKSDIGKGMTIFSGFHRLGPYWYKEQMSEFDPTKFNWHEAKIK